MLTTGLTRAVIVVIICVTLLLVLAVYWIMPVKKMKAVNKELTSLLQILPTPKIVHTILEKANTGNAGTGRIR